MEPIDENSLRVIALIALVIGLCLSGLLYYQNISINSRSAAQLKDKEFCKSDTNPIFGSSITDIKKIDRIIMPGTIKDNSNKKIETASILHSRLGESVPVFAPTDSVLYKAEKYKEEDNDKYRLHLRVSCEVFYVIDGLDNASSRVEEFLNNKNNEYKNIDSGEELGRVESTPFSYSWRFGLYNTSKMGLSAENGYEVSSQGKFADCPYDNFTSGIQASMKNLLDNRSSVINICLQ